MLLAAPWPRLRAPMLAPLATGVLPVRAWRGGSMFTHRIRRIGCLALLALVASVAQAQSPGALRVELEAAGSFTRSHAWSIDKRVTPDSADRFIGETQELAYTLTVVRGDAQDAVFRVAGRAVISNPTAADAVVSGIALSYGGAQVAHDCA